VVPGLATEPRITLVLGGARSGKSRYAEELIAALPGPWVYVATAEPLDDEMIARIAGHRARRGPGWQTVEAPRDLCGALINVPAPAAILIDCMTLWLSNLMLAQDNVEREIDRLDGALGRVTGPVAIVANEVGLGIVPDNVLSRRFRDVAGVLNQRLAARADRVVMLVAGLPMVVK
jgi:adenosylcobinamide kinase/adenosylcobinamide-phosphate guanylyltransferase